MHRDSLIYGLYDYFITSSYLYLLDYIHLTVNESAYIEGGGGGGGRCMPSHNIRIFRSASHYKQAFPKPYELRRAYKYKITRERYIWRERVRR